MKITRYTWINPKWQNLPLEEADWDDEVVKAAGFNPEDEEVWVAKLTRPWRDHPKGSYVIGECIVEGHHFVVVEP